MLRFFAAIALLIFSQASHADDLDQARNYINAMEYTQAIQAIEAHLKKHESDVTARYLLARTYAWDNQYAMAEKIYDQLLLQESDNTQYMFGKAQALIWQNKNSQAIPLLDNVVKHIPEQVDAWQLLILALQQTNKPEDRQRAVQLGQQARKRFPKMNWDVIVH